MRNRDPIIHPFFRVSIALMILLGLCSCKPNADHKPLILYTSQDLTYVEKICRDFEEEHGIKVQWIADGEAVKTVGLVHRMIQEKQRPVCDLFWNNEILRSWQLVKQDALNDDIRTFGYRSRRFVINTNLMRALEAPQNFLSLTNPVYKGRFAMAYPVFGTTATHLIALRSKMGHEAWRKWCEDLRKNEPHITDGNSGVVKAVGRGVVPMGITDYDDIVAGRRQGLPIDMLPLFEDSLLIPNSIGFPKNKPLPPQAGLLRDFLLKDATLRRLMDQGAIEGLDVRDANRSGLIPDWPALVDEIKPATETLKSVFVR